MEAQIAIPDPSLANYVKGVLWSLGLRFEKPPPVEYLRHAAALLERVEARHRTGFYYENLCYALEHVDYDRLKTYFAPLLGIAPPAPVERSDIATAFREQWNLVFVLVAAGRAGDWRRTRSFANATRKGRIRTSTARSRTTTASTRSRTGATRIWKSCSTSSISAAPTFGSSASATTPRSSRR